MVKNNITKTPNYAFNTIYKTKNIIIPRMYKTISQSSHSFVGPFIHNKLPQMLLGENLNIFKFKLQMQQIGDLIKIIY